MRQAIHPREYRELIAEKDRREGGLRDLFIKKLEVVHVPNDLREIVRLRLKGGPKDLSTKLDFYLYQ